MITFQTLQKQEFKQYADFLNNRTPESLRSYFGSTVSAHAINQLVDTVMAKHDTHFVCVAKLGEDIVGTVHIAQETMSNAELGIMLAEEFRRQGLADKLITNARSECSKLGITEIDVEVARNNLPMRRLAAKHKLAIVD